MLIDALTHATPDGKWFSTNYDSSTKNLLDNMDKCGVDKAVIVALAGYIENDFIFKLCKEHSDRLIPGVSINPVMFNNSKDALLQIKMLFSNEDCNILKLHPRLHKYDISDTRFLRVLEEIAQSERKINVWLDTLLRYPGAAMTKPPVDAIHELVGKFPSIDFVLLHACGHEILSLAEAIRGYKNAFLDVSFTLHRYIGSSVALDLSYLFGRFDERIVFGSDFPEVSISQALADFNSLTTELALDKRERILWKNLRNLLGI